MFRILIILMCICSCDTTKNESDKVVEIATREKAEENVIVQPSTDQVAEELSVTKRTARPLQAIGKRTIWNLEDVGAVIGAYDMPERILDDYRHEYAAP